MKLSVYANVCALIQDLPLLILHLAWIPPSVVMKMLQHHHLYEISPTFRYVLEFVYATVHDFNFSTNCNLSLFFLCVWKHCSFRLAMVVIFCLQRYGFNCAVHRRWHIGCGFIFCRPTVSRMDNSKDIPPELVLLPTLVGHHQEVCTLCVIMNVIFIDPIDFFKKILIFICLQVCGLK